MTLEEALAQIEALKAQNATVIGEKRAAAAAKEAAEQAAEEAKAKAEAEKNKAATTAAKAAGDLQALEKALTDKHAAELAAKDAEIAKLKTSTTALEAARDKMVLDGDLSKALDEAGVKAEFKPAVLAMIRTQNKSEVTIDADGNFVAKIGDKKVPDFVKDFAASDAGKAFVANGHTGGGAAGGGGTGGTGELNPYDPKTKNMTLQGKLEKEDPAKANRLRAAVGLQALASKR